MFSRLALLAFILPAIASPINYSPFPESRATCSSTTESCTSSNPPAANSAGSCCYNGAVYSGGKEAGLAVQTQFWDTSPSTGPSTSWTIHGLWPDYCDGTYPASCTSSTGIPTYTGDQIDQLLQDYDPDTYDYFQTYYKDISGDDSSFREHEYNKHGTCFSTLRTSCQSSSYGLSQADTAVLGYFQEIAKQFKARPAYSWLQSAGITPSSSKTYTLSAIQNALSSKYGAVPYVGCSSGALSELWFGAHITGPLIGGTFKPVAVPTKSNCPSTGVKYLPK